jgi:phage head maturation protease
VIVDHTTRTITGLVVRWGMVARARGRAWRFAPGALTRPPGRPLRLLLEHDPALRCGRLAATWSTDLGQWARCAVDTSPLGDVALALAALDPVGFSVGVDLEHDAERGPDPVLNGVLLITACPWTETSLTLHPVFEPTREVPHGQ